MNLSLALLFLFFGSVVYMDFGLRIGIPIQRLPKTGFGTSKFPRRYKMNIVSRIPWRTSFVSLDICGFSGLSYRKLPLVFVIYTRCKYSLHVFAFCVCAQKKIKDHPQRLVKNHFVHIFISTFGYKSCAALVHYTV